MTNFELELLARIAALEEHLTAEPEDWDAAQEIHFLKWLMANARFSEKEIAHAH